MSKADSRACIVLVVEDEWLVSTAVVGELRKSGCIVLEARSGEEAIAHLNREPGIGVVFTDLRLGGRTSGWDVAEAFRKILPDVGVIYTSGRSHHGARSVPGSLFFGKPYNPAVVRKACMRIASDRIPMRLRTSPRLPQSAKP